MPKDATIYACWKEETDCDYCVCTKCYDTTNNAVKYLKQAINQSETKFNNILWKVNIIKYKDHFNTEFDAIQFIKLDKRDNK